MLGKDRVAPNWCPGPCGIVCLELCGVERGEAFKVLLHMWRQSIVCRILGGPECVATAAAWGAGQEFEHSISRRLDFIGDLDKSVGRFPY